MKCVPQMYYFETAKVRPTHEDGNVLAWNGEAWLLTRWTTLNIIDDDGDIADYYTHWMQLPKAPSVNDQHAFLEI